MALALGLRRSADGTPTPCPIGGRAKMGSSGWRSRVLKQRQRERVMKVERERGGGGML